MHAVHPQGAGWVGRDTVHSHLRRPTDLTASKQGSSDRKLARNHNMKNLIKLHIMCMRVPALYPEDEVGLRVQGAPDAGGWLSLPASNTTINDDVVQRDPRGGR